MNIPKSQAIIARLMIAINVPNRRNNMGLSALQLLKACGPILHPCIWEMWDQALPKLMTFLESKKKKKKIFFLTCKISQFNET